MSSRQGHYEDTWKFVLGARIPPRALQLVATVSDHPHDAEKRRLYCYLALMCAPITTAMLKESEGLRERCNEQQDLHADDNTRTFTWSADGFFTWAASAKCVIWNHCSIEQFSIHKSEARQAAVHIGAQLAKIIKKSCAGESSIELLFAIREGKWMHESPGAIRYAVALGALAQIVRACQSVILMSQLAYSLECFQYFHRPPHVSVLDLVALQNFGSLLFYTYKGHEDATTDSGLVTIFFEAQARAVQYYVGRRSWMELDLESFLRYTHGREYTHALQHPQKLDVIDKHCDFAATRQKKSQTGARKRTIKQLSRKMSKLAVR